LSVLEPRGARQCLYYITEITTPLARDNILGTRNYTAPEYLKDGQGSNRSDIFSLGVICYEMLCGRLPYDRELSARNLARVRYRSAVDGNPNLPGWVDAALRKAVSIRPELRYSLLSEFIHDLSHPNANFNSTRQPPLTERNPVTVWRTLAIFFMLTTLAAWMLR